LPTAARHIGDTKRTETAIKYLHELYKDSVGYGGMRSKHSDACDACGCQCICDAISDSFFSVLPSAWLAHVNPFKIKSDGSLKSQI